MEAAGSVRPTKGLALEVSEDEVPIIGKRQKASRSRSRNASTQQPGAKRHPRAASNAQNHEGSGDEDYLPPGICMYLLQDF